MERLHEAFPGFDGELEKSLDKTPEREPTPEELLEAFESGRRFDDEDEKARDYNARLDAADAFQDEVNQLSEQIAQATSQLAGVPLTGEQLTLLGEIEQLLARRRHASDSHEQTALDETIEAKTKQLAALPVTSEQGSLLDAILEMIDAREVASVKLRAVFND